MSSRRKQNGSIKSFVANCSKCFVSTADLRQSASKADELIFYVRTTSRTHEQSLTEPAGQIRDKHRESLRNLSVRVQRPRLQAVPQCCPSLNLLKKPASQSGSAINVPLRVAKLRCGSIESMILVAWDGGACACAKKSHGAHHRYEYFTQVDGGSKDERRRRLLKASRLVPFQCSPCFLSLS